jgi:hypothetical protein
MAINFAQHIHSFIHDPPTLTYHQPCNLQRTSLWQLAYLNIILNEFLVIRITQDSISPNSPPPQA